MEMEMETMINHFSHEEHPLTLLNLLPTHNEKGDDHTAVINLCYGCQEQISEAEAYSCLPCGYFLHKGCAQLPPEITHPMHSHHPLVLFKGPPYISGGCVCNACCGEWKFFTYHCSSCEFDLDVSCATLDRSFEHKICHEHPLISLKRPASFLCNACRIKDEDSSYVCSVCPFWIHKKCALLPTIVDYKDHDHPLLLAYAIPLEHRSFSKYCVVCGKKTHPSDWCYYCGRCRYFIHPKCLVSDAKAAEGISIPISDGDQPFLNNGQKLIKLPSPGAAQQLINHSLAKLTENNVHLEEVESVFSHGHPLTLSKNIVQAESETMIGAELICDHCVEPISNSDHVYYSCVYSCGYLVHVTCSRLPNEIQILKHPEHRLLRNIQPARIGRFPCHTCQRPSNGLFYKCEQCEDIIVCIKCASVGRMETVVHNAHKHLLLTTQAKTSNPGKKCNGCGYYVKGFGFDCEPCHFFVCYECVLLPPSTKQRWDEHELILRYPPYSDHPDEFYCVLCEEELNPNLWMYHCGECDYSFHVYCIPQIRFLRNLKFGRTICVDNHPHPLTHVLEAKYKSYCECCGKRLDWPRSFVAFQCNACPFYICRSCAVEKEIPPDGPHFSYIIHSNQDEVDDGAETRG